MRELFNGIEEYLAGVVLAIVGLLALGLVIAVAAGLYIVVRNTARHVLHGNVRRAVHFATAAAYTAVKGDVHGRGGALVMWLLAFVTYREGCLKSIPTGYSERLNEYVYTTIEATGEE